MLPQWQLCGYFGLILSFQSHMYLYIVFHILVHSYGGTKRLSETMKKCYWMAMACVLAPVLWQPEVAFPFLTLLVPLRLAQCFRL